MYKMSATPRVMDAPCWLFGTLHMGRSGQHLAGLVCFQACEAKRPIPQGSHSCNSACKNCSIILSLIPFADPSILTHSAKVCICYFLQGTRS